MLTKPQFISGAGFRAQLPLLALPVLFVISALWTRAQGGPGWLWFNLDPDYFYLLDALNILNLLVVERREVTGRLADSVVQEMAQPLNDIVTEAQSLMEEYIGDDTMRHQPGGRKRLWHLGPSV